jgi:epoxyqueuosine reductase
MLDTDSIREKAVSLGFSLCGFAKCEPLEDKRAWYAGFVERKGYGVMQYLERYAPQRMDPELLLPGARTVVCVAMDYYPPERIPEEGTLVISKYAYGPDYHPAMKAQLDVLGNHIRSLGEGILTRGFVDSGPVLEKAWAVRSGIGWQGKNTLVINRDRGSFYFIGVILTTLAIVPDPPAEALCGACERCVKACPTGALDDPYRLNIPLCISYHTIEQNGEIPGEIRKNLRNRVYGCDLCQDVCPYNRLAANHPNPGCGPRESWMNRSPEDWQSMDEAEFDRLFAGTAVARLGYRNFMRNVAACMEKE